VRQVNQKNTNFLHSVYVNREIFFYLFKIETFKKYQESLLGSLWLFLNPLLLLTIYTFFYGFIINKDTNFKFIFINKALNVYLIIIFYNIFTECINKSTTLLTNNINYIKKINFPLDILAWITLSCSLLNFIIGFLIWLLFSLFLGNTIHITIIYTLLNLIPYLFFLFGIVLSFSGLGIFIKDLTQFTTFLSTSLLFLSPIFFNVENIPKNISWLIYLNPLSYFIENQKFIMNGNSILTPTYFLALCTSLVFAWISYAVFTAIRKRYSDFI
jgi:lipopolysaccharide transport system permease protein